MSTKTEVVAVPFHGDTIVMTGESAVDEARIVFKHTCESIGIGYDSQLNRLKRQGWATTFIMKVVADDGKTREMVAVDFRTFTMWLATIDASRIADPQVRAKVGLYQNEAADALSRHFRERLGGGPARSGDPDVLKAELVLSIAKRQAEAERQLHEFDYRQMEVERSVAGLSERVEELASRPALPPPRTATHMNLRGSVEYHEWLKEASRRTGMQMTKMFRVAMAAWAEQKGLPAPPER